MTDPQIQHLIHSEVATAFGSALASTLSWSRNKSILWCIFHGILSWIYVIFFALTRKPSERN